MNRQAATRPVAVVTGASRGIGRAVSLDLAADHHVVALARSQDQLHQLATEIATRGGQCTVRAADVTDADSVRRALDGIEADLLVNNAGVGAMKPFLELTWEEWRTTVDTNVNALYHVTHALLPGMIARGRGHIVTIGSIAGRSAFPRGSCYAATKHFVNGWAESLMLEVRHQGVRVSVVNPGSVATSFSGTTERDPSWMLRAEDVAAAVRFVLSTPPHALIHSIEVRASRPAK
jgi:short-subunit dehydrogenase